MLQSKKETLHLYRSNCYIGHTKNWEGPGDKAMTDLA